MTKALVILAVSTFISSAFAAEACKVYGISDSPQKLKCHFPNQEIQLSCVSGKYFLNKSPVVSAFHLEVESGTVPLVFKAQGITMTVVMDSPIGAQLSAQKMEVSGTCK